MKRTRCQGGASSTSWPRNVTFVPSNSVGATAPPPAAGSFDLNALIEERAGHGYALHDRYINAQVPRLLRTIGFDRVYVRGEGAYLYDRAGRRYLDMLAGFGVYALGRNHPTVRRALAKIDDPGLLRIAFVLDDKTRIDHVVAFDADARQAFGGLSDRGTLLGNGSPVAAFQDRVAAQRNDDAHYPMIGASTSASVGEPSSSSS